MARWYVTYSEFYPIYESAEGGYYYLGKRIIEQREFQTFRRARLLYKRWRRESDLEFDENMLDGHAFENNFPHCKCFGVNGKYIGEGYIVELTRKPVKEHGWEPYC